MDSTKSFHEISYELHEKHYTIEGSELSDSQKAWFAEDTSDYWRHARMYSPLTSFLKKFPESKWLTIGDGKMGLDSIRLKKIEPSLQVLPTDISADLLAYAKKKGIIADYREENAEKLSFKDNEFDFTFCKESYHHFPRPFIALYEMLRVSRKAIVLIEPNDGYDLSWPGQMFTRFRRFIKKILGKKNYHIDHWSFEEIGNFIYPVSKREMEKAALGLNLPAIAYYYYNDHYSTGAEYEKLGKDSRILKKIKHEVKKANFYSWLGIRAYTSIIAIIFKEAPSKELCEELNESGFKVIILPLNPYVNKK